MQFTTSQILELAIISKDALRHWKKLLPPIKDRDGRSATYTFSELVSLCVIAEAVQHLAIPISRFVDHAEWLFVEIERNINQEKQPIILFILPNEMFISDVGTLPEADLMSVVRIKPIIVRIRGQLTNSEKRGREGQLEFIF